MNHKASQPMTEQELKSLIKKGESESVEFKESPKTKEEIAKTICAFSNDMANKGQAGLIFIGIKDQGECAGLKATDEMLRNISSIRSDGNIQPLPLMSVQKAFLDECEIIVVETQPSNSPPIRYNGRCWIRVGSTTRQASREEESRLTEKRQAGDLPEDMRGVSDANIKPDLNIDYFTKRYLPSAVSMETLAENERVLEEQMRSLRLLDHQRKPTMTAILIMGTNPRNWIPGAYIQFIRFEGKALTDPVKNQTEVSGPLPEQTRRIEDILKANISTSLKLSTGQNLQSPDYPFIALSQLARNAIIHRNYKSHTPIKVYWFDDRIEIQSPGGPYGELRADNFGEEGITAYRNPTIAEAFKNLGFVERFGFGLPQARKALKENGNPELKLEARESAVLAIIKKREN